MRASLTWAIASIPWLEHYHHHTNDFKLSQLASLLSPNESVCLLSAAATTRRDTWAGGEGQQGAKAGGASGSQGAPSAGAGAEGDGGFVCGI